MMEYFIAVNSNSQMKEAFMKIKFIALALMLAVVLGAGA